MMTVQPILFDARVQKEARVLAEAGWQVRIWSVNDRRWDRSVPVDSPARKALQDRTDGIEVRSIELRSRRWRFLPKVVNKALQAVELGVRGVAHVLRCRPDVCHCHDLTPGLFALMARVLGAKMIYDAHEVEVRAPNPFHRRIQRFYERAVVRASNGIITVNDDIAKLMEAAYRRPVTVVMNRPEFVDPADLNSGTLRRQTGYESSVRILAYVGYVEPRRRGIEHVIDAMEHLPDNVVFLILGVGRLKEFEGHLRAYMADKPPRVARRVRLVPPVPPDQVASWLSGADLSVMLYARDVSKDLATPNKLFESIMARVPVIGTDIPILREYVLHNGVGPVGAVVEPSDAPAVAATISRLLEPSANARMKANADQLADRFSWESQAETLRRLYDSL